MSYTPYVDFESGPYQGHPITRVGCMRCNITIGSKDPLTKQLYHWDNKRDVTVLLSNGSRAFIPVCSDCLPLVTDADMALFESTVKYGWVSESVFHRGGPSALAAFRDSLDTVSVVGGTKVTGVDTGGVAAPVDDVAVIAQAATDAGVVHSVADDFMAVTILRRA